MSDPASFSDIAKAAMASPATTRRRYLSLSPSEPNNVIGPAPSPCIANEKSARPDTLASVSRAMQRDRTSSCAVAPPYAAGTVYRNHPPAPSFLTAERQAASTSRSPSVPATPSVISRFAHSWSFAASSRCESVKKGQPSVAESTLSGSLECRFFLLQERSVRSLELLRHHALRLHLRFVVERFVDLHRPFLMQTALGDCVRQGRAVRERLRHLECVGEYSIRCADLVVKPPALGFVSTHGATQVKKLARAAKADYTGKNCASAHVGA